MWYTTQIPESVETATHWLVNQLPFLLKVCLCQ